MIKPLQLLAKLRIKSFMQRFIAHLCVEYEIRTLEKAGKRADPRSVVSRILALVERIIRSDYPYSSE